MRRAWLLPLVLTFALGWAQQARAGEGAYAWALGPPPFGPNSSAAADGSVLTLIGAGTVGEDGSAQGVGTFEIADSAGNARSAGGWTVSGPATVDDQGPLPEDVWENILQRGVVTARIALEGVGEGTITIYCAFGRNHLEGFHLTVGGVSYRKIVSGGNSLTRLPI